MFKDAQDAEKGSDVARMDGERAAGLFSSVKAVATTARRRGRGKSRYILVIFV